MREGGALPAACLADPSLLFDKPESTTSVLCLKDAAFCCPQGKAHLLPVTLGPVARSLRISPCALLHPLGSFCFPVLSAALGGLAVWCRPAALEASAWRRPHRPSLVVQPLPHFLPSVLCTSACLLSVSPTRWLTRQDWTGRTCLSIDCCAPSASCLPAQSGCSTGCQAGMKCWVAQRDQTPLLGVGGGWGGLVNAAA